MGKGRIEIKKPGGEKRVVIGDGKKAELSGTQGK